MSRMKMVWVLLAAGSVVVGCASQDEVAKLGKRVEALEQQAKAAAASARAGGKATPALEQEAKNAMSAISAMISQGQIDQARAKIASFGGKYNGTSLNQTFSSLSRELSVFGKDAPSDWGIEKWFQGQDAIKLDGSGTTLVVFWEEWCPHCRDEVPKLEEMYEKYKGDGLKVIGVTKINKTATEQSVADFIASKDVKYPIAKENGTLSSYFSVSSIPAAAVVKDGKVIWRGHPAAVNAGMIKNWLSS